MTQWLAIIASGIDTTTEACILDRAQHLRSNVWSRNTLQGRQGVGDVASSHIPWHTG